MLGGTAWLECTQCKAWALVRIGTMFLCGSGYRGFPFSRSALQDQGGIQGNGQSKCRYVVLLKRTPPARKNGEENRRKREEEEEEERTF